MLDYINITKIKVNITLSVKSLQIFKIEIRNQTGMIAFIMII